jgi:hypothetical protein
VESISPSLESGPSLWFVLIDTTEMTLETSQPSTFLKTWRHHMKQHRLASWGWKTTQWEKVMQAEDPHMWPRPCLTTHRLTLASLAGWSQWAQRRLAETKLTTHRIVSKQNGLLFWAEFWGSLLYCNNWYIYIYIFCSKKGWINTTHGSLLSRQKIKLKRKSI